MTFDPTYVEVTSVTLPKDHCVQVPWEYINVCGYSDQFCKKYHILHYYIHTHYIYYIHTTSRMSDHIVSFWTQFRQEKNGTNGLNFKGCGMGPWLVLVSPCFWENVVATCKIGSFLCSWNNLLQKNVIVLFFRNQISKWRSFEKRAIFDLLLTFFGHQGKVTKIPSAHISLTYIHVFCSPCWLFLPYQFWKKNTNLSDTVSLWYESWCWFLFAPFWNNQ